MGVSLKFKKKRSGFKVRQYGSLGPLFDPPYISLDIPFKGGACGNNIRIDKGSRVIFHRSVKY
jgi:hypothetical protein